jgi:hypothetical protein
MLSPVSVSLNTYQYKQRYKCVESMAQMYRVIKKSLHLMITIQKVMFKVSPASLQTFIDTLTVTPSVIPTLCYHGTWLKLFKIFLCVFCTVILRCTRTFWSPCIFQLCCSLNHTYINQQLMHHQLVILSTRRERNYGNSNILAKLNFKKRHDGTAWVLKLTTQLALPLTDLLRANVHQML